MRVESASPEDMFLPWLLGVLRCPNKVNNGRCAFVQAVLTEMFSKHLSLTRGGCVSQ